MTGQDDVLRLVKSHGLGNDYLVVHSGHEMNAARVRRLCDRHTGVGGDGVLEPVSSACAAYGLRIWNPDGSRAEKSGNGLRIFARWLVDHRDAPDTFHVEVDSGVVRCVVDDMSGLVTVEMGRASLEPDAIPCRERLRDTPVEVAGTMLRLTAVGMGNPHCVAMMDVDDLDAVDWRRLGRLLETDARFPNRTNVQFARVVSPTRIKARIWERGAGETRASGSSACAVAVAAHVLGRVGTEVAVDMEGGTLEVTLGPALEVTLKGPVEQVGLVDVSLKL